MNRYSATIDARIPHGHDRFSDTTSTYPARLLEHAVTSTAVSIPITHAFRITGWHVAVHPRGAVLTIECAARDRATAEHALRTLFNPSQHADEVLWQPFADWSFALSAIRAHPANP